jgi:predicted Rossmann fold nucleotide-binding protein DprA/Smf involved in DNA uptake
MPTRTDDAIASLLLVDRLTGIAERPLSPSAFWSLVDRVPSPSSLFGQSARGVAVLTGLPPDEAERVTGLLDGAGALAFELERLDQQGISVLSPFDDGYPARFRVVLGNQAPPVLVIAGSTELLSRTGVGIVGARDIGRDGIEVARQVATTVADQGLVVFSGGAKGVDREAMSAALGAGGATVGFIAESMRRRLRDPSTRRSILDDRIALATPFAPDAPFSPGNAMARNKLIYAAARVTIVISAALGRGGTWEGATEALRRGYGNVGVWMGAGRGPGNQRLVDMGGTPVVDAREVTPLTVPRASLRSGQMTLDM